MTTTIAILAGVVSVLQAGLVFRRGLRLRGLLAWLADGDTDSSGDNNDENREPAPGPPITRIGLVVPAYTEQLRLPGLADRLIGLDYPNDLLRIVIVTANEPPLSGLPDTGRVAGEQVARINAARGETVAVHEAYDGAHTSMAIQLDRGVMRLRADGLPDDGYVGVLPADAYPRPDVLTAVDRAVKRRSFRSDERSGASGRRPDALQQPTTHLRTFPSLSDGFGDTLRRAAGVYQSMFAFAVEAYRLRRFGSTRESRGTGWRRGYTPLSGHGLYIRAGLLAEHDGFPTEPWCEDIALTFGYYCRGADLALVRSIEENESPLSWPAYLRQSATWFRGAAQFGRLLAFARRAAPAAGPAVRASVALRRLGLSAAWVGGPLVAAAAILTLAVTAAPVALVALALWISVLYWSQLPIWRMCRSESSRRTPVVRAAVEATASVVFLHGLAPLGPLASIGAGLLRLPLRKAKAPRTGEPGAVAPGTDASRIGPGETGSGKEGA